MVTLADSLVPSSARPLPLRRRSDLIARQHQYQGRGYWVIKEPVGLKYFRFQEEEYFILRQLDGRTSLDEIKQRFEQQYAPQKITLAELQQFVSSLHRSALVVSGLVGQGTELKQRRDQRKRQERFSSLTSILAIRFRGIDPEWLLARLYPLARPLFSLPALVACLLLTLGALGLIAVQFSVFLARLPAFHEFFGPESWLLLAIVIGVTKILHELGHGLACKHFGGECHEIGLMLLVFTPCLYCNVSDSWMLPSKWQRAAIGAAGIYVEVVLASLATFIWWFSEPGLLNHICLQVMFVSSVSTVLLNGNPLLRYDGYYILSDLIEIPNLRQKASQVLSRQAARWCLGMEIPDDPFLPKRGRALFALYTIASVVYRWVVVISILLFLNAVLKPYGLQVVGQTVAVLSIVSMLGVPLWKLVKFFRTPGRMRQVKRNRLLTTLGIVTAVIGVVTLLPLPHAVRCTFEIRPRDATAVYVQTPGRIEQLLVEPGDEVTVDQPLALLANADLELDVQRLVGREQELAAELATLQRQRFRDPEAVRQLAPLSESLASIQQELVEKREQLSKLAIRAPAAGFVLPPPSHASEQRSIGVLPGWSGSPFDGHNLGAHLAAADLFCRIGDPTRLEAVLVIDQADVDLIGEGSQAKLRLEAFPGTTLHGQIASISRGSLEVTPASLSRQAGGELATRTDKSGRQRPLSTSYQAQVLLDELPGELQAGLRGRAKVSAPWRSLGGRLWRYLSATFHFQL